MARLFLSLLLLLASQAAGAIQLMYATSWESSAVGGMGLYVFAPGLVQGLVIEPRTGTRDHEIMFYFDEPPIYEGVARCTDASGQRVGSVSTRSAGSYVMVSLHGIPDGSRVRVSLENVNGTGAEFAVWVGFLLGDADNSGAVTNADVDSIKALSGTVANDPQAYRRDVNASGFITAADILRAKGRSGRTLQ